MTGSTRTREIGISIVEVMVTIIILSIIVVSTVAIVNKNQDVHARIHEEYALFHEVRAVINMIEDDVSGMFVLKPRYDLQAGQEIFDAVFIGEPGRMSGVTLNYQKRLAKARDTHFREVEYFLIAETESDLGEASFSLMKKSSSYLDQPLFGEGMEIPALTEIKSWKFQYYNDENDTWQDKWDSRALDTRNRLPLAVSVIFEVFYKDPIDPQAKPTAVPFATKFLADSWIEQSKVFELSKSISDLQKLLGPGKGASAEEGEGGEGGRHPSSDPGQQPGPLVPPPPEGGGQFPGPQGILFQQGYFLGVRCG